MFCPVCKDSPLAMSERQGVEIDYCPRCRGVWLDRGELDKIIERVAAEAPSAERGAAQPAARPAAPQPAPASEPYRQPAGYPPPDPRYPQHGYPNQHGHHQGGHYRKKKSLLGELFDFD